MMNAMFMLLNSIEARARFGRKLHSLHENCSREVEFSHEQFPFHLNDDDSIRLGEAAVNSTHLTSLHLDVTAMTVAGTRTLVTAIAQIPSLHTLRLEGDLSSRNSKRLTALITNKLLQAAQKNPSIHTIQLVGNHFGSPCVTDCLKSLKELLLSDVWHDANLSMVQRLADGLVDAAGGLQKLTLRDVGDHVTVPCFRALAHHTNLTALHIGRTLTEPTAKALRHVLDTTPHLSRLHVFGCHLHAENLGPIVQGLISNATVQELVVASCRWHETALPCFAHLFRSRNTTLHALNFTESIASLAHLRELLRPLHRNTSITKLDICKCALGPHAGPVINELLHRNRHLEQLDVDRNGPLSIAAGITRNDRLRHLDVSMTDLGNAGWQELVHALPGTEITHLFACGNEIEQLDPFMQILEDTSVTHLYLHGNRCGTEGAIALGRATQLRLVHMDHCRIGAAGAAALLANEHITQLSIRNLDLRNDTDVAMEVAMAGLSRNLESLHVSVEFLPLVVYDSDNEEDPDTLTSRHQARSHKMKQILINRAVSLKRLSTSDWFQLDKDDVSFVLERNAARTVEQAAVIPHALSMLSLSTAFWMLRQDPAAWVTNETFTQGRHKRRRKR